MKAGRWNVIPVMATVATRPCARCDATLPPARSIWASSQPPKMSPLGLASAGIAMARKAGSPASEAGECAVFLGLSVIGHTTICWGNDRCRIPYAACLVLGPVSILRAMADLFDKLARQTTPSYSAQDIED